MTAEDLQEFADVILATGVRPRKFLIEGNAHQSVTGYSEILSGKVQAGKRVVIVGGGGIAFDVALFLLEKDSSSMTDVSAFKHDWGIDQPEAEPQPRHEIAMLQRSTNPSKERCAPDQWCSL